MSEQVIDKESLGAAIGRIPSGVFIVTATDGTERVGMMASWVQQVGFEPPCISVAVHPDRELHTIVERSKKFTVNVLASSNGSLMKAFGKYSPTQFDGVAHQEDGYGLTLTEAVATLQCELKQVVNTGSDHHLLIGQIQSGQILNQAEPMVHLRKSGFNY